jgi:hypothetical protein
MKKALLAAGLVLVAAATAGCGDDGPPTDASKDHFCGVFDDMLTDLGALDEDAKPADAVKALKKAGGQLAEVGTPEDMPADARKGYELILDEIEQLDEDASKEDVTSLGEDVSDSDQKSMDAYTKYLSETCADEIGGADPQ